MSRQSPGYLAIDIRFPRVSGDEPAWAAITDAFYSFSPRERG